MYVYMSLYTICQCSICIYVYMCIHIYTSIHIYIHIHIHVHIYIHTPFTAPWRLAHCAPGYIRRKVAGFVRQGLCQDLDLGQVTVAPLRAFLWSVEGPMVHQAPRYEVVGLRIQPSIWQFPQICGSCVKTKSPAIWSLYWGP